MQAMDTDMIDTTRAAEILGVRTNRAALAIIKSEGLVVTYGRYKNAKVSRTAVEKLAEMRRDKGVRRGRPSRQQVSA